jgi:ABC-type sugar transport system permease subunit
MKTKANPFVWIIPALVFFIVFLLFPLVFGVVISFYNWNGLDPNIFRNFAGLANYIKLTKDPYFLISLKNTLFFTFGTVVVQNVIAFFLAIFLFFGRFKNSTLIRAIIFVPGVISSVVVALVWRRLFMSDGLINVILNYIGIQSIPFLTAKNIIIWAITFVHIWQWTGFNLVLMYAGLQSMDLSLIESSSIDGANFWQNTYHIVFPILKPIIWLSVLFNFIDGFRVFDIVYNMTKGGPAHESEVLTSYVFFQSFGGTAMANKMGYASAISVFLMAILLIFTGLRTKYMR